MIQKVGWVLPMSKSRDKAIKRRVRKSRIKVGDLVHLTSRPPLDELPWDATNRDTDKEFWGRPFKVIDVSREVDCSSGLAFKIAEYEGWLDFLWIKTLEASNAKA